MSVDPMVNETGQAYAYAGDDPVSEFDPLGLWSWNPVSDLSEVWNDSGGKVVHAVATHGADVGLIVGGVVLVVGATVLTGGLIDVVVATAGALSEEGADLEVVELAVHAPFVLLPGIALGGFGVTSIGLGVYGLVNHKALPSPKANGSPKVMALTGEC